MKTHYRSFFGSLAGAVCRHVFAGLVFFASSLPVQGQFLEILDGYHGGITFGASPDHIYFVRTGSDDYWRLRYFSSRYLREVSNSLGLQTNQVLRALPFNPRSARIVDTRDRDGGYSWLAYRDVEGDGEVKVEPLFVRRWRVANPVPLIRSRFFAGLADGSRSEHGIRWVAGFQDNHTADDKSVRLVHYEFANTAWTADTLADVPGKIRSLHGLHYRQNRSGMRSISVATDSLFAVFLWRDDRWQQKTVTTLGDAAEIFPAVGPDDSPLWLVGSSVVRLIDDTLQVRQIPFSAPESEPYPRAFLTDNAGVYHLLYRRTDSTQHVLRYMAFDDQQVFADEPVTDQQQKFHYTALHQVGDSIFAAWLDESSQSVWMAARREENNWDLRRVDRTGDPGMELSVTDLQLDYTVDALVAYFESTHGDLKVAYPLMDFAGNGPAQYVDTVGVVGRFPKIFSRNGKNHIVYFDQTRGLLKYARQEPVYRGLAEAWQIEVIDSSGFVEIAPAFNAISGDTLRVAYAHALSQKLVYAWHADSLWRFETIAEEMPDIPGELSIFTIDDTVFVGYLSDQTLRLARRTEPGVWQVESIASQEVPYAAAFVADWSGRVNIAYRAQDGFQSVIRHLRLEQTGWQERLVTRAGTQGSRMTLKRALAYYRIPILVLSFHDDGYGKVQYFEKEDWAPVGQSLRSMSDTQTDFIITDLFTFILFYRALPEQSEYDQIPAPDLVGDVVIAIINEVSANRTVQASESKMAAYPNPFNAQTTLEYTVDKPGHVEIQIFDMLGRQIATLQSGKQEAGTYRLTFAPQASGLYFCRYSIAGNQGVLKLALVK